MELGDIIKAKVGFFSKRDNSVTLTQEQAQQVHGLVKKELAQISRQMHDVVDKGALDGKTIQVSSICLIPDGATKEERASIEQAMQELIEKYGENMPVNTAHRLSCEWGGEEKVWNDNPGCHERQLQRRDGSPFFPVNRRVVTIQEILDAQEKDSALLQRFKEKFEKIFHNEDIPESEKNNSLAYASSMLQETQNLLEEAAGIGGNLNRELNMLQALEDKLIKFMNDAAPNAAEILEKARSVSSLARMPFLAQSKNKTIPENEIVPSLLAENLDSIAAMGVVSRALGKDFTPSDADIRVALDNAVEYGFSKQRAGKILAAWGGYV
jgi:chemotaxis regulatin CheY-phosphate phosphatase CheZ